MKNIFITGGAGFVGKNLVKYFGTSFNFLHFKRGNLIEINQDIVIHLAGKAHDLKKTVNPEEYYKDNTELTKKVFDAFLVSEAKVFITLSSVKAVTDKIIGELLETDLPNPITHYGKSKLLADQYILSKEIPEGKRVYILRPCMIHGPENKGNLNMLFKLVSKNIPWPLGKFSNSRSFCSIYNLMFIISELIQRDDIDSGVYNVSDDEPLSTNEVISLIANSQNKAPKIWRIPKCLIKPSARIGDLLNTSFNTETLEKLTSSFVVNNDKLKRAIKKPLPINSRDGLIKTFNSFV